MTGHGFDASDAVAAAVERGHRMRAMSEQSTVVLVHGAWHGAWCWDEVVSRLSGDGLAVVAVDLPSVASGGDLYDDARAVRAGLDDTPGDKVVVGHSYGGVVITEAAAGAEGVRHLVYLTAFMLDEGEALADSPAARRPPGRSRRRRQDDERVEGPREVFYNTCAPQIAEAAAARLRPHTVASFVEPVPRGGAGARCPRPTSICDLDNAIPVPGAGGDGGAGGHHAPPARATTRPFLDGPRRGRRPDPRRGA